MNMYPIKIEKDFETPKNSVKWSFNIHLFDKLCINACLYHQKIRVSFYLALVGQVKLLGLKPIILMLFTLIFFGRSYYDVC